MTKVVFTTSRNKLPDAFSLVEVLVVISIVSLLLGILVPSLNKCKAFARQVICQSRLRQWGLAFETYASANDGFYPHIDGRDRTDFPPETPIPTDMSNEDLANYYFGWVDVLPTFMGLKPWRDYALYQKPGANTIFQCPSAQIIDGSNLDYPYKRVGFFSYAMNSCLELDSDCWPPNYPYSDPTGRTNNMPSFLQTNLIKMPSNVFLLYDQLLDPEYGYNANILNPSAGKHCGAYPREFSARHRKGENGLGGFVLFTDYHIEWKKSVWNESWPDDLEVPPGDDKNWYPYQ